MIQCVRKILMEGPLKSLNYNFKYLFFSLHYIQKYLLCLQCNQNLQYYHYLQFIIIISYIAFM